MSGRLEELERRIHTVGELHEIVGAMVALASMRLEEAARALVGSRAYAATVSEALADALSVGAVQPPARRSEGADAILVFAPEHGFCGSLARRLVELAAPTVGEGRPLYLVGSRALIVAQELRLPVVWQIPMPTQLRAAPATARSISEELARRFAADEFTGVEIVAPAYRGGGRSEVARRHLMPVDPPRDAGLVRRRPPRLNLSLDRLLPRLLEEYAFAELAHATIETLAAENGARLVSMQSARRNIDDRLDDLKREERGERQSAITLEIAEIAAGVTAFEGR